MVSASRLRLFPLPNWNGGNNPYYDLFYGAMAHQGAEMVLRGVPDRFAPYEDLPWLLTHAKEVDWVHLHFAIYYYTGRRVELVPKAVRFLHRLQALRSRGVRLLWTCHNLLPHESPSRAVDVAVRVGLGRLADVVVVHSDSARQQLRWFGRQRDVVSVPLGHLIGCYPDEIERAKARAALAISNDAIVFLQFGYMRPYKGTDELIAAFRTLPDPRALLVLAGGISSTAYRAEIERRAAGDPRIRLLVGAVPNERVPVFFRAADVAVLPFRRILTSFSLMLALSQGVPVVIPSIAAIREYVNDDVAYVIPRGEPLDRALARAAERIASGSLMSGQPVVRWAQRFSWDHAATTVAAALRGAR